MTTEQSAGEGTLAQAKEKTQRLASQAQEQLVRKVGPKVAGLKDPAATALGRYAEAVRQLGQQFRSEKRELAGQYAERAADQIQRLAHYLERTEVDELVRQAEDAARRRPAAFLGAASAAGVAAARFVKSSRRQHALREERRRAAAGTGFGAAPAAGHGVEREVTGLRAVESDSAPPSTGAFGDSGAPSTAPLMDDQRLR
jgi:hypothetical protein